MFFYQLVSDTVRAFMKRNKMGKFDPDHQQAMEEKAAAAAVEGVLL